MTEGIDTGLTYDAVSNTLTAVNLTATGTITGTFGGTIATATNANNVYVTPTNTAGVYYPTFVSGNTASNKPEYLDTDLTYDAGTNTLTCPTVTVNSIGASSSTIGIGAFLSPSYTMPADTTVMNTIVGTTSSASQTFNLTKVGQTYFVYRSADTGIIPFPAGLLVHTGTVTNTGIYSVSFMIRESGPVSTGRGKMVSAWIYVSSPAIYGGLGGYGAGSGQLGLNLVGYASPYLNFNDVGVCFVGSWTGLINAGATLSFIAYNEYDGPACAFVGGNTSNNYLSITRIA